MGNAWAMSPLLIYFERSAKNGNGNEDGASRSKNHEEGGSSIDWRPCLPESDSLRQA